MITKFVLLFALWFGAAVALICAIYVLLISRRNNKKETQDDNE